MTPFCYTYNQKMCSGSFERDDGGFNWYKVIFNDQMVIILPAGIRTNENKLIWVQKVLPLEKVWQHDLIQSLGEGLEQNAEIEHFIIKL
jgi:hypothetical protein